MKLNPLMKIENLSDEKCIVKLLIDQKKYQVNTKLFIHLIDIMETNPDRNTLQDHLIRTLSAPENVVSRFIDHMLHNNILLESTQHYPVKQIEYWQKHKWLNALIYHLESQNITCFDDGTKQGEDNKNYEAHADSLGSSWKTYANAPVFTLPQPDLAKFDAIPLEEVLLRRNSFSPFRKKQIPLADFSAILSAANRDLCDYRHQLTESSKSLYRSSFTALETYVFIFSVDEIVPGLYHYQPQNHALSQLQSGDYKNNVIELCIGQRRAAAGGCLFLLTAHPARYMLRYKHERAYRNLLTNVAEFAHQYIFYSTALEYSTFLTPAIKDEYAAALLNLKGFEELPLYTVAIG